MRNNSTVMTLLPPLPGGVSWLGVSTCELIEDVPDDRTD